MRKILFNKLFLTSYLLLSILVACHQNDNSTSTPPVEETINIPGLPPDPGEPGKDTLAGIDSDHDGVRDDLQRYIAIEYQDSEKIRRVLTDAVKADQEFILNANDKEKVLIADKKRDKASDCLFYIDPENAYMITRKLDAELLNTKERIKAYFKADAHLGGMFFESPKDRKSQCSFDPDQLAN